MEQIKMRSRALPDLTNWEIEQYLARNDIIIVPVGHTECLGPSPVDGEYVDALAWAKLIAEETDGLYLPGAGYFHPGGTQTGRGTIHMGMTEGLNYTLALAHSLLDQGFKRQLWIPAHCPTTAFLQAMVTQFFDETHVSALYLSVNTYLKNQGIEAGPGSRPTLSDGTPVTMDDILCGKYKLVGRLDAIPSVDQDPFEPTPPGMELNVWDNKWFPKYDLLAATFEFGFAPVPYYFGNATDHGGYCFVNMTREEIEHRAEIGERYLRETVEKADFKQLTDALGRLQKLMKEQVFPEHGDHLPKSLTGYQY